MAVACLLAAAAMPARAQPGASLPAPLASPPPVLTPAEARVDRDGDGLPDRLGDTLAVGGRASVWAGRSGQRVSGSMQSGGSGLSVRGGTVTHEVAPGDSLVVTGRLASDNGTAYLAAGSYRVAEGERRVPVPVLLGANAAFERYEGMLVTVDGRALLRGHVPVGSTLALGVGSRLVYALAFGDDTGATFADVVIGQEARVTGVLGQYDREAPYDEGYQVYPAGVDAVEAAGFAPETWRRLTVLAVFLLAAGLVGLAAMQRSRARQQEATQRSDRRFRLLFDASPNPVVVGEMTPEGPVILDFNRAAERNLQHPREALIGKVMWDVAANPDGIRAFYTALEREGHAKGRYQGALGPFEVEASVMREGERTYLLGVLRDVTEAEAAARELVHAREEAEAYARLQASFVANMSHEIRTPLSGIIGFAEVLREELPDAEHRSFAGIIESGARRLLDTLSTVLDLARLSAGTGVAPRTPCDLSAIVTGAACMLQPVAERRGVTLVTVGIRATSGHSNVDALERIVYNLVGNAIKFTPEGGRVAVSLAETTPDEVVLTVADTGIGMAPALLERLYTPFTQASTGVARDHEGAGLGLSITHRLVALLGGRIGVVSAPGEGTTFTVTLPAGPDLPAPPPTTP